MSGELSEKIQCEAALIALQKKLHIQSPGELSEGTFEEYKEMIHSDVLIKCAVYENSRTIKALEALKQGDVLGFGV